MVRVASLTVVSDKLENNNKGYYVVQILGSCKNNLFDKKIKDNNVQNVD